MITVHEEAGSRTPPPRDGCVLLRHGGRHDFWINPTSGAQSAVPRHNELKKGIVRAICRQLGIPDPPQI